MSDLSEGENIITASATENKKAVLYFAFRRLSIVTVALSVTIRLQFAIDCLRCSNQQGVGQFGPKFRGVPLGADPSCLGYKERTFQAN